MRYISFVRSVEGRFGPPPPELMNAIGALGLEAARSGVLIDSAGIGPTSSGTLVRVANGKVSVLDGPFAIDQEVAGGYAIFEAASREEAIAFAKRFMDLHARHWPAWQGVSEVRPIFDAEEKC